MVLNGFITNTKTLLKMFKRENGFKYWNRFLLFLNENLSEFLFSEPEEKPSQKTYNSNKSKKKAFYKNGEQFIFLNAFLWANLMLVLLTFLLRIKKCRKKRALFLNIYCLWLNNINRWVLRMKKLLLYSEMNMISI